MWRHLLPTLLLIHCLQGKGYCSSSSSPEGVYSENPDVSRGDHPSSDRDIQNVFNNTDGERAVLIHNQPQQSTIKQQDLTAALTDNRRQRRHIGSVAAFRGLPGPFNKFNPVEWPLSAAGWDRKGFPLTGSEKMMMVPGANFADYADNSYGDDIKDKRFPDVLQMAIQKNNQPPNPVLMRNNPGSGSSGSSIGSNKNFEIVTPPHNEARARAVNRLLRLLSEAKAKSARVSSISKKFLGALARSNALPTTTKTITPLVQYKGSTAIPLPGKRTPINPAATRSAIELNRSEPKEADIEFGSQAGNDSIDDMYSDDVGLVEGTDEDQIDEYDENITSMKRNIASLAAKGGLIRPSRTYNRVPQFSF